METDRQTEIKTDRKRRHEESRQIMRETEWKVRQAGTETDEQTDIQRNPRILTMFLDHIYVMFSPAIGGLMRYGMACKKPITPRAVDRWAGPTMSQVTTGMRATKAPSNKPYTTEKDTSVGKLLNKGTKRQLSPSNPTAIRKVTTRYVFKHLRKRKQGTNKTKSNK